MKERKRRRSRRPSQRTWFSPGLITRCINTRTAEDYCNKSLARQDNVLGHFFLGLIGAAEQQYDKAIPELEKAAAGKNGGALAGLAYGHANCWEQGARSGTTGTAQGGADSGLIVAYRVAAIHLALGDKNEAIKWLRKSSEDRENWINQLKVDPVMDPLRSDLRFQQLMRDVQLS